MFELISKLSFTKGLNILLILFGCVAGPFCFLYRFYFELYSHNDFVKILFLSLAIGVPVSLAMSFFNALMILASHQDFVVLSITVHVLLIGLS